MTKFFFLGDTSSVSAICKSKTGLTRVDMARKVDTKIFGRRCRHGGSRRHRTRASESLQESKSTKLWKSEIRKGTYCCCCFFCCHEKPSTLCGRRPGPPAAGEIAFANSFRLGGSLELDWKCVTVHIVGLVSSLKNRTL
jgi:hypothetical protein